MIFQFRATQTIARELPEVWKFFSCPKNLERLIPPSLHFRLRDEVASEIYPGQIITYELKPLPAYRCTWVTEITQVERERYFVDEQRDGPYQLWHHEHHFRAVTGGVLVEDLVHYKIGWWALDNLLNRYVIRPRLEEIFRYRLKRIEEMFG